MKNLIKSILLLLITIASITLLGMTGRGLSGIYLVGFIIFLLLVFIVLLFLHDKEALRYKMSDKIVLGLEILMISIVVMFWISIIDFYFVEMFKNLKFNLDDNTYWVVFFGGLIPIFFAVISVVYFLGSFHFSNTVRILIFFAFLSNSNLNDFLYYLLLDQSLPSLWPWVCQPVFLFGDSITTVQLLLWTISSILMGFIAFVLPYEALTVDFLDDLSDEKRSTKGKMFQLGFVFIFSVAGILYAYNIIPKIKESVYLSSPLTQAILKGEVETNSSNNFPEAENNYAELDKERILLAEKIIDYLNTYYDENKIYPVSKGNCINEWDSSFTGLSFVVDGIELKDPEQEKSKKCDYTQASKNILYYSDSKRFALLMPGMTISRDYQNIYIPSHRDVYWFDEDLMFFRDWSWNASMIVFMYEKGDEVTKFNDLDESIETNEDK